MILQLEEIKQELDKTKTKIKSLSEALKIEESKSTVGKLEKETSKPGFWDNLDRSQEILSKISSLNKKIKDLLLE